MLFADSQMNCEQSSLISREETLLHFTLPNNGIVDGEIDLWYHECSLGRLLSQICDVFPLLSVVLRMEQEVRPAFFNVSKERIDGSGNFLKIKFVVHFFPKKPRAIIGKVSLHIFDENASEICD